MGKKKTFNDYTLFNDHAIVHITNKENKKFEIMVDIDALNQMIELGISWNIKWASYDYYVCCTEYLGIINGKGKYKIHYLHRWITQAKKNEYVDHISRNTLDNRRSNLRVTTNSKNMENRNGKNSNNKSGYRNVSLIAGKWVVQLQIDGRNTVLGKFDDVHEAGKYAEEMRKTYYGDFAGRG